MYFKRFQAVAKYFFFFLSKSKIKKKRLFGSEILNLKRHYDTLMLELLSTTNYKVGLVPNGVLSWGVPKVSNFFLVMNQPIKVLISIESKN
jgi:hypothetical protein